MLLDQQYQGDTLQEVLFLAKNAIESMPASKLAEWFYFQNLLMSERNKESAQVDSTLKTSGHPKNNPYTCILEMRVVVWTLRDFKDSSLIMCSVNIVDLCPGGSDGYQGT